MPAANKKRVATLNLGMQTVTLAVFESGAGDSLVLSGVARTELLPDPAADASRAGQLKIALDELRAKLKWTEGPAAVAVPSQGVFARFVKIPKVEADKVDQMLFYEAQQNIPYPIEEVALCHQILPESEPDKFGALILATKLDDLEASVEAVQAAGFVPEVIETSPTALYNSLRYNYPELQGCTLLIDIGARATNLVFVEADRLFIRTLPVGGNSISAALQKRFQADTLQEAERLKLEHALIQQPGTAEAQGDTAEVGKVARTVMTRIHNEITRSITFYRTNQGGSPPARVFLTGGGAGLPYTLEFFNEKLALPVEFFNPLRRVSVSPSASNSFEPSHAHSLGECTGLATRLLFPADCPLQLEMQSPRANEAKADKSRRPFLVAAVVLLAATLAAAFLHHKKAADQLVASSEELNAQIGSLEGIKGRIEAAAGERRKIVQESAELAAAPVLRNAWAAVLDEVGQRIPARNIWVTAMQPMTGEKVLSASGGAAGQPAASQEAPVPDSATPESPEEAVTAIAIDGLYLENEEGPAVVDAFVDGLCASDAFAIDAEKKNDVVKLRAAQSGETWAYEYKLVIPLRRPIPL